MFLFRSLEGYSEVSPGNLVWQNQDREREGTIPPPLFHAFIAFTQWPVISRELSQQGVPVHSSIQTRPTYKEGGAASKATL